MKTLPMEVVRASLGAALDRFDDVHSSSIETCSYCGARWEVVATTHADAHGIHGEASFRTVGRSCNCATALDKAASRARAAAKAEEEKGNAVVWTAFDKIGRLPTFDEFTRLIDDGVAIAYRVWTLACVSGVAGPFGIRIDGEEVVVKIGKTARRISIRLGSLPVGVTLERAQVAWEKIVK